MGRAITGSHRHGLHQAPLLAPTCPTRVSRARGRASGGRRGSPGSSFRYETTSAQQYRRTRVGSSRLPNVRRWLLRVRRIRGRCSTDCQPHPRPCNSPASGVPPPVRSRGQHLDRCKPRFPLRSKRDRPRAGHRSGAGDLASHHRGARRQDQRREQARRGQLLHRDAAGRRRLAQHQLEIACADLVYRGPGVQLHVRALVGTQAVETVWWRQTDRARHAPCHISVRR